MAAVKRQSSRAVAKKAAPERLKSDPPGPSSVGLGTAVYVTAWIVEIVAATIGLFIAFSQGVSVFMNIPEIERDLGTYTRAIVGALPFIVIAILEPTKIYLASGLYHSRRDRRGGLGMVFLIGLVALTFVTFETMFNALIQQNTNVTRQVRLLVNERFEVLDEILTRQQTIDRLNGQTPEAINSQFAASVRTLEADREARKKQALEDYETKIANLRDRRAQVNGTQNVTSQQPLRDSIAALQTDIAALTRQRDQAVGGIINRYQTQINENRERIEQIETDRQRRIEDARNILFGRGQLISDINESINLRLSQANEEQDELEAQRLDELRETRGNFNSRIRELTLKQDGMRKNLADQNIAASGATAKVLDEIDALISTAEDQYARRLAEIDGQFDQMISEINIRKKTNYQKAGIESAQIPQLEREIDELEIISTDLRQRYRENIEKVQVYQLTAIICGSFERWCFGDAAENKDNARPQVAWSSGQPWSRGFDVANIPEEKVRFVGTVWFGSTAAIVATMGTFLAFISFVLSEPPSQRGASKSRTSRILFLMLLRFTNLIRSIGVAVVEISIRLGDSVAYALRVTIYLLKFLIETLLEFIALIIDAFRILIIVISRNIHERTSNAKQNIQERILTEQAFQPNPSTMESLQDTEDEFQQIVEMDNPLPVKATRIQNISEQDRKAGQKGEKTANRSAFGSFFNALAGNTRELVSNAREGFKENSSALGTTISNSAEALNPFVNIREDMQRAKTGVNKQMNELKSAQEKFTLPKFNVPEFNLPKLNLPKLNLPDVKKPKAKAKPVAKSASKTAAKSAAEKLVAGTPPAKKPAKTPVRAKAPVKTKAPAKAPAKATPKKPAKKWYEE